MEEEKKSYYAIIPANVRYDESLTPNAKLLYGEITALCNEKGFCWSTNDYFANLYKVSKVSISKWISSLVENGYITSDIIYKDGTKEILNRYLRIVNDPIKEKLNRGIKENFKDNNTSNNNTFNNKERKKATEYDEIINSQITNEDLKATLYEFIKMRKFIKKPMTDRALQLLINKLHKLANTPDLAIKVLEQSIVHSWQDIHELKQEYNCKANNKQPVKREYTKEEYNNMYDNIFDVEI